MKAIQILFVAALSLTCSAETLSVGDRTITKVVRLLQSMLAKSKKEGDEERTLYAKFKCYCDDNEQEKKDSIKDLATQIALLESKIDGTQGSTGSLSGDCAQLTADIAENEQARNTAEEVRKKAHSAFEAAEEDMKAAISAMTDAIDTLADVGADQTLAAAEDHKKFMAGYSASLLSVKTQVRAKLDRIAVFLRPNQQKSLRAFLQAPFTGSYTSQSGQVVGILKNMRDTFRSNLATAKMTEKTEQEAHDALMKTLNEEHSKMSASLEKKQEELGSNDENLADLKDQLTDAKSQKADDEEFLAKLLVICEDKATQYTKRKELRANEDAAIAEAIAILNSDEAFATFGKVDATSTGSTGPGFLQVGLDHRANSASARSLQAQNLLERAAGGHQSMRLSKIATLLVAGNPFKSVLNEIAKMLKVIENEGKADKDNLDWCNDERTEKTGDLTDKMTQISTLEEEITSVTNAIDDPESGLKIMIQQTEDSLKANVESQKSQTKARIKENLAYQGNIKTLVRSEEILAKAIKALKKYYDVLEKKIAAEGASFLQLDQEPPETFGTYKGQSEKGGDAIGMIEFILEETKKEELEAHSDEEASQHAYEDSMADLKGEEAETEENLVNLKSQLAAKEKELVQKEGELKTTVADKEAIEAYLLKIKPGCDFITKNFDARERNRETETNALNSAVVLLKDTPTYKAAKAEEHVESFGDCKDVCMEDEDHVECKACQAEVTVPGYCAGHADTKGC